MTLQVHAEHLRIYSTARCHLTICFNTFPEQLRLRSLASEDAKKGNLISLGISITDYGDSFVLP